MNRVAKMMDHLARNGATGARVLYRVARLPDSGRVYALLKSRILSGQIERAGNKWQLNPDWNEELQSEIRDARMILERAGYTVVPPGKRRDA